MSTPANTQTAPIQQTDDQQPDAALGNDPTATPAPQQGAPLPTSGQTQPVDPSAQTTAPQMSAQAGQPQVFQNAPAASMQAPPPVPLTHTQKLLQTARSFSEAMTPGGFTKTSIDPNTGETTRTQAPLTARQIGLAIALEALTGGLTGAGAHGPNAVGQAAAAGLAQGQKIAQQHQDQQDQLDKQAQQDLATQFSILEGNMRIAQNAQMLGKQDQDMHNASVAAYAPQLAYVQDNAPDSIQAAKVSEQDAKDVKKWPVYQYQRVPDGVVPRLEPDGSQTFVDYRGRVVPAGTKGARPAWDNTYSIVDSKASAPLVDADGNTLPQVKDAMGWHFLQTNNPDARLAPKAVPLAQFNIAVHKTQTMNLAQNEVNKFRKATGQDPLDLHPVVDANGSLPKDIDRFHVLLNANKHSYEAALGLLAKEDLQGAAGVAAMFGGPDAIHAFDVQQKAQDDAAEEKAKQAVKPVNVTDAISTLADPNATPAQKAQAQAVLKVDTSHAAGKAGAEEAARVANNPNANGGPSGSPDAIKQTADAVANGVLTLDTITDRPTRSKVERQLALDHPNLNQNSVTLTPDERKKKQLADSDILNLNAIADVIKSDPNLIGAIQGRVTSGKWAVGSNDPNLAKLKTAVDQYGLASIGIHSSRSYQNKEDAVNNITNNLKNGPQAVLAAVDMAKKSAQVFSQAGTPTSRNGTPYIVIQKPQQPGQAIDNATIHKYVTKYGSAAAARAAAQQDGWALPQAGK